MAPRLIDLDHLGHEGEIAAWIDGDVLIDCGPMNSLPRLLAELGETPLRVLLLTHIHLDHAGAAAGLVEQWPDLEIHVHPVGLPHLADPSKLERSARRLYGDDMDALWGEVMPVPERNLRAVADGARLHGYVAAYTPGHASHHIAYLNEDTGHLLAGDATGVRVGGADLIMPHAPPPDIDLEGWDRSLDLLGRWQAEALCLPHFGVIVEVEQHLESMREALHQKAGLARVSDLEGFVADTDAELQACGHGLAEKYWRTSPLDHMYLGLRRYWDKKQEHA